MQTNSKTELALKSNDLTGYDFKQPSMCTDNKKTWRLTIDHKTSDNPKQPHDHKTPQLGTLSLSNGQVRPASWLL